MLELRNVTKTFAKGTVNEHTALRDVSLTLKDDDFITILPTIVTLQDIYSQMKARCIGIQETGICMSSVCLPLGFEFGCFIARTGPAFF